MTNIRRDSERERMDPLLVLVLLLAVVILVAVLLVYGRLRKPSDVVWDPEAMKGAIVTSWRELGIDEDIGVIKTRADDILHTSQGLQSLFEVTRGRAEYGEFQLEQILKDILPSRYVHIRERLPIGIPDAYVKTPQGILCIDSKFPLDNYRKMLEATDGEQRARLSDVFCGDVQGHVDAIRAKYVKPAEGTVPFAFGFIPSEAVYQYLTECAMGLLAEAPRKADAGVPDFKRVKDLISKQASKDMIEYFVSLIIEAERKITVKEIKFRLLGLRGAPLLINYDDFLDSLSDMAHDGQIVVRTPQGLSFYKKRVRTELITDDTLVEKPEVVEHISIEETYNLLKEKKSLGFNDLRQTFPVSDESRIGEVIKELPTRYEDVYILEEGKIVPSISDIKRAKLFSLDKAAGLIEGHVTALINDLIAVKYDDLLEKVRRTHLGVDEKLLGLITEELDIVGKVRIDREKGSVTVPPDKLDLDLRRRIKLIVNRKGKLSNEDLVGEITKQLPVDDQVIKNGLALLCDEGIDVECREGVVSRRTRPGVPKEGKPIRFEKEGVARELGSLVESELAGEQLEFVQLTVREGVDACLVKNALEALNQAKAKIVARRRA